MPGTSTKSNCLLAALAVRRRVPGSHLRWWPGWNRGWREWPQHPWGHFFVEVPGNRRVSWSGITKDLSAMNQLWFSGKLVHGRQASNHEEDTTPCPCEP